MLAIRLPEDIESRLDTLAKETGRTKSYYVREAILTYLDDMESTYFTDRAYRHILGNDESSVTFIDVLKAYALED